MNDETTTAEAPVEAAATPTPKAAKPKAKPKAEPVAKAAAKPKAKPSKPKADKKDSDPRAGRTFNEVIKSRMSDGSLRKSHVDTLRALSKAGSAISMEKIVKGSKVNYRTARPTVSFLVSEGLAKEQLSPDESGTMLYRITSDGTKALSKAEKAA
jgi:predicted transcriptional regulator